MGDQERNPGAAAAAKEAAVPAEAPAAASRISAAEVEHVARLARLELSPEEKVRFTTQLNAILEAVDKLKALDTAQVEPTAYAVPMQNVFRPDQVRPSWPREKILQNAPEPQDGYFRVPRIMEEE
ncbi:MAG: Asp-tRNA(Asn)/Glu-tRNA(Gln) amidotransferase subunit GatC [Firmicutes bacterium]|nr:Asp-tRNA(Asn)/Glu-tRNA(Gln) amidotransferase subunit GatC [Bacillota bacterium]